MGHVCQFRHGTSGPNQPRKLVLGQDDVLLDSEFGSKKRPDLLRLLLLRVVRGRVRRRRRVWGHCGGYS